MQELTELEQIIVKALSEAEQFATMPTASLQNLIIETGLSEKDMLDGLDSLLEKDLIMRGTDLEENPVYHLFTVKLNQL